MLAAGNPLNAADFDRARFLWALRTRVGVTRRLQQGTFTMLIFQITRRATASVAGFKEPQIRRSALGAALLCLLTACSGESAPETTPSEPQAATAADPAAPAAEATATVAQRAESALRAQRLFTPPGDNAFELFLQATVEQPDDVQLAYALRDLVPYAVLHIEQRIAAGDQAEAERVLALLERAEANAPALPRLQRALQRLAEAAADEAARESAEAEPPASAQAATAPASPGATAPTTPAAADSATAPAPSAGQAPPAQDGSGPSDAAVPSAPATSQSPGGTAADRLPEPAANEADAPEPAAAAPGPAGAGALPKVVRQVPPRYPPGAGRRRLEGTVEVGFTINPDGSVSDVEVIRSDPPRIFDRAAVAAMEEWQYEAPGRSVRASRSFVFKLD